MGRREGEEIMYKKIVQVKTRQSAGGIEPDLKLEKGMSMVVLEYSPDKSSAVCLVVRSDVDDFSKLAGEDLAVLPTHAKFNDKLIRVRDVDGNITDSLNAGEIGTKG